MFPKLSINLKNKYSYTNSGNFFSKSLIIKENLEKHKKIILIVENDKLINQYKKVLKYIRVSYQEVNNYSSLVNILKSNSGLFLTTNYSLKEKVITQEQLLYFSQELQVGESYEVNNIIKKLGEMGYEYSDFLNHGTYKKSGDTLSVIDFYGEYEYKISFWGESIEEILKIKKVKEDVTSSKSTNNIYLGGNQKIFYNIDISNNNLKYSTLQEYIITSGTFTVLDSLDFSEYYDENTLKLKTFCSFDFVANKSLKGKDLEIDIPHIDNIDSLKNLLGNGENKLEIYSKNINTINNFIEYNNLPQLFIHEVSGNFLKSFDIKPTKNVILCDDILSKIFIKKRLSKSVTADLDLLLKITPGDYVVHIDHGIGIFKGIIKKELPQTHNKKILIKEYVEIHYKGEDKLFVPITEVSRINKFIGGENPKLTGLNTTEWSKKLKKVGEQVAQIAEELLEVYSQRKMGKSFAFISDSKQEQSFQSSFPYIYTQDQNQAINEILGDMEKSEPMDRLLVGDVGFGKTEVAFNAIYRAFINKKQSVFIAPLVVLAYEHYEKAVERFKGLGIKIAVVTRMESVKKVESILIQLNNGEIDLVIGTHKLLSDKIRYKNLGLLIVDEEHKFGVSDKEKIKKLKTSIDILSMSATPIPRSLNMALSDIKQISIIKTPPQGRKDISTIISRFSERVIFDGCETEFQRGGQIYFVHNRVQTLVHFEKVLQGLFPEKKIVITHGQLPGNMLEKRIIDFKNKKYDILLTTTVIENGIDFPNVNTIFINEAQNFGISQIHQLRGRVGRSDRLGHCYLLYKKENLGSETAKRLKTIVNYSYLGAGFELAMKDLEIRGGGDLLGSRQSGQTSEIGVNLYLKMIEQKINELKKQNSFLSTHKGRNSTIVTKIDLQLNIGIPDSYFDSDLDKINFYREIESLSHKDDLNNLIEDFRVENNILNTLPEEMQNFFTLLRVKLQAGRYNISQIKKVGINYQLDFASNTTIDQLKNFLDLDKEVKFIVTSTTKLRTPVKNFTNTEFFLQYLLNLFSKKVGKRKIKLKR